MINLDDRASLDKRLIENNLISSSIHNEVLFCRFEVERGNTKGEYSEKTAVSPFPHPRKD